MQHYIVMIIVFKSKPEIVSILQKLFFVKLKSC